MNTNVEKEDCWKQVYFDDTDVNNMFIIFQDNETNDFYFVYDNFLKENIENREYINLS